MTVTRPVLVGTIYHARWMVPADLTGTGKRKEAEKSLQTDSLKEAQIRLPAVLEAMRAEWKARAALRKGNQAEAYRAAAALAGARGFACRPAAGLAEGDPADILARLDAAMDSQDEAALLGFAEPPKLMLSGLVDEIEHIKAHEHRYKDRDRMRLWRHPRRRAVHRLMEAITRDIPVLDITRDHALAHRRWWIDRLGRIGGDQETVNNEMTVMSGMISAYHDRPAPDHGSSFYVGGRGPRGPSCLRMRWEAEARGPQSGLRAREAASRGLSEAGSRCNAGAKPRSGLGLLLGNRRPPRPATRRGAWS